jgi:hypothetical protein
MKRYTTILLAVVGFTTGCTTPRTPQQDLALFANVTHIRLYSGDHSVTTDDPKEIERFISKITLVPRTQCSCLCGSAAVFETDRGEVHVAVTPHWFDVTWNNRCSRYQMPEDFHKLFESKFPWGKTKE